MRRRWILGLAGLALLLLAGVAAALLLSNRREVTTSSAAAHEAYKEALANEYRFYFKESRVGYAKALELDPNFAMAMLGLARQSSEEQSKTLVGRAVREEGRLTERERLHVEMYRAYSERRSSDGLAIAKTLHAKYPDDRRAASMLAHDAQQRGNSDEALLIFESLLTIDPNNADAYNQIGYLYGYKGEIDKAVDALQKYQFIAPDTANPFDSLGENLANAGRYPEAIENLNRALAIKADFSPAYEHLGVVYEGMGDYAKALESYRKAMQFADNDEFRSKYVPEAIRAACEARDLAAAEQLREDSLRLPKNPYSDLRLEVVDAAIALFSGRPAEADAKLTQLRPKVQARWREVEHKGASDELETPEISTLQARAKEALGKPDEAFKLWETNAHPKKAFSDFEGRRSIMEARAHMAAILARRGELDEAEKLIAENRKWNPSWAPSHEAEATVAELRRTKVLAAAK